VVIKMNKKGQKGAIFGIVFVIVLVLCGIFLMASIDMVDASQKGVMVRFGEVKGVMQPGYQFTGPMVSVYPYDLRIRRAEVSMVGSEAALDNEGQEVYTRVQINYRLNPADESIKAAYSNLGKDEQLEQLLNLNGRVREGVNSVIAQHELKYIIANVDQIKDEVDAKIREKFPSEYFILDSIIVDNFDYHQAIKNAINNKKTAVENEATETALANAAIAKAEGAKQVEIKQAEAAAEKQKLAADAKAHQIRVEAEAEAFALKSKSQELTPMMVQNNLIDKWNGAYPKYMMGNSDMLMQLPVE